MTEKELPADLTRFIRSTIPSYDAAVLLVLVSRDPQSVWSASALAERTSLPPETIARCAEHFERAGLLAKVGNDGWQFRSVSQELRDVVAALQRAYDQRPVTLVRVIHSSADEKIQSFADAFKLKRE